MNGVSNTQIHDDLIDFRESTYRRLDNFETRIAENEKAAKLVRGNGEVGLCENVRNINRTLADFIMTYNADRKAEKVAKEDRKKDAMWFAEKFIQPLIIPVVTSGGMAAAIIAFLKAYLEK